MNGFMKVREVPDPSTARPKHAVTSFILLPIVRTCRCPIAESLAGAQIPSCFHGNTGQQGSRRVERRVTITAHQQTSGDSVCLTGSRNNQASNKGTTELSVRIPVCHTGSSAHDRSLVLVYCDTGGTDGRRSHVPSAHWVKNTIEEDMD